MRIFAVLVFTVLAASAQADEQRVAVDFRCLSGGASNSIHLEYRTFTDKPTQWITAYVKYKNSSEPIPLILKSKEGEEFSEGRPWQYTVTWLEVVGGKFTGEYEVMSQGANIYNFTYKNYRNDRTIHFYQDSAAYDGERCKWE